MLLNIFRDFDFHTRFADKPQNHIPRKKAKKCDFVALISGKFVDSIQKFSIFAKILINCLANVPQKAIRTTRRQQTKSQIINT